MSKFLAVDTSSRYLTVLAVNGEKKVLRHMTDCAMQHSKTLMGEVERAFTDAGLTPAECDFFAAVTGPGSFTGIRIGIAAAKGLAQGAGKPLVAITSFGLLAYNVNSENFYTVIDAAHGNYYVCGFGAHGRVTLAPAFMNGAQVAALGAPLYGFEDLALPDYTRLDIGGCLYPAAVALRLRAGGEMRALYVKKPQAEEAGRC